MNSVRVLANADDSTVVKQAIRAEHHQLAWHAVSIKSS